MFEAGGFWGMPLVVFFREKVPFPLCSVSCHMTLHGTAPHQQLKGNPELQATELPSMHLALSRETPEVFRVTQHTNIPQDAAQSKTIRFHKDTNNIHRRNMHKAPNMPHTQFMPLFYVKLGGGNEFMAKGPLLFINWAKNVQLH